MFDNATLNSFVDHCSYPCPLQLPSVLQSGKAELVDHSNVDISLEHYFAGLRLVAGNSREESSLAQGVETVE